MGKGKNCIVDVLQPVGILFKSFKSLASNNICIVTDATRNQCYSEQSFGINSQFTGPVYTMSFNNTSAHLLGNHGNLNFKFDTKL